MLSNNVHEMVQWLLGDEVLHQALHLAQVQLAVTSIDGPSSFSRSYLLLYWYLFQNVVKCMDHNLIENLSEPYSMAFDPKASDILQNQSHLIGFRLQCLKLASIV